MIYVLHFFAAIVVKILCSSVAKNAGIFFELADIGRDDSLISRKSFSAIALSIKKWSGIKGYTSWGLDNKEVMDWKFGQDSICVSRVYNFSNINLLYQPFLSTIQRR